MCELSPSQQCNSQLRIPCSSLHGQYRGLWRFQCTNLLYLIGYQIQVPVSSRSQKRQREINFLYTIRQKENFQGNDFRSENTPTFYTAIMQFLRDDWILLFQKTKHTIVTTNFFFIIDDILLFSNHASTILHYLSCDARAFTKYILSFKLNKCDFFQSRVEYVGHDLTANGNCPAASKFDLLQSWFPSLQGISLLSFIVLCCFYNRYCPWFETSIAPLRRLQRHYHRNNIPIMGWTQSSIHLFENCKTNIVTFPRILRYDSSKPTFLKIDQTTGGMDYMLMQLDDSFASSAAIKYLSLTDECSFELSFDEPRL